MNRLRQQLIASLEQEQPKVNQLTVIDTQANVEAYRASTNAAEMCKEIVIATASTIQGRRYVAVEGWQAIAIAHGCTAGARGVEVVEGGVRAIGEVRRMSDGAIISTAEGFVGEDEPTWYGGQSRGKTLPKRPDYAIRAMAQTRAISRACRSAFAHVVVMMKAGLATTPAEEVPFDGFDRETGEITEEKVPGIHAIKSRLRVMMDAGNREGITLEEFKQLKRDNKADLKTIRDANHGWWTGDGEDFEGYEKWMAKRIADLEQSEEQGAVITGLIDGMNKCRTKPALAEFLIQNEDLIDSLDGAEVRRWEAEYQAHEAGIGLMDTAKA